MTLLATRIIALIVLFILTLLMGIGPVILFRFWNRKKQSTTLEVTGRKRSKGNIQQSTASAVTLQLLMFFGGGVLLATCFVHLIPEVRENFDHYFHSKEGQASFLGPRASSHDHSHGNEHDSPGEHEFDPEHHHHDHGNENETIGITNSNSSDEISEADSLKASTGHNHKHKVPYVELAICGGFFLIYFLEEIIHLIIGSNHHEKDDGESIDTGSTTVIEKSGTNGTVQMAFDCAIEQSPNGKGSPPHLVSCVKIPSASPHYGTIGYDNHGIDLKDDSMYPGFRPTPIEAFGDTRCDISPTSSSFDILNKASSSASATSSSNLQPLSVRFLRGFVTIVAFSAHSVFDGVAIGLQKTTSQLWTIFFAISMHKLVVAFAIGLELYEQTSSLALTWVHMILFSIMSPIGILIVILTESEFSSKDSPVIILLSAVATGTILYIVFFEILQRDRCSKIPGIIQLFILVIGFACMSCLTLFIDH